MKKRKMILALTMVGVIAMLSACSGDSGGGGNGVANVVGDKNAADNAEQESELAEILANGVSDEAVIDDIKYEEFTVCGDTISFVNDVEKYTVVKHDSNVETKTDVVTIECEAVNSMNTYKFTMEVKYMYEDDYWRMKETTIVSEEEGKLPGYLVEIDEKRIINDLIDEDYNVYGGCIIFEFDTCNILNTTITNREFKDDRTMVIDFDVTMELDGNYITVGGYVEYLYNPQEDIWIFGYFLAESKKYVPACVGTWTGVASNGDEYTIVVSEELDENSYNCGNVIIRRGTDVYECNMKVQCTYFSDDGTEFWITNVEWINEPEMFSGVEIYLYGRICGNTSELTIDDDWSMTITK